MLHKTTEGLIYHSTLFTHVMRIIGADNRIPDCVSFFRVHLNVMFLEGLLYVLHNTLQVGEHCKLSTTLLHPPDLIHVVSGTLPPFSAYFSPLLSLLQGLHKEAGGKWPPLTPTPSQLKSWLTWWPHSQMKIAVSCWNVGSIFGYYVDKIKLCWNFSTLRNIAKSYDVTCTQDKDMLGTGIGLINYMLQ